MIDKGKETKYPVRVPNFRIRGLSAELHALIKDLAGDLKISFNAYCLRALAAAAEEDRIARDRNGVEGLRAKHDETEKK